MPAETKTRREVALERALIALHAVKHPLKDVAASMLIGLIGAESAKRRGEVAVHDEATVRKALHVELVRMGLPNEVIAALKWV